MSTSTITTPWETPEDLARDRDYWKQRALDAEAELALADDRAMLSVFGRGTADKMIDMGVL